MANDEETRGLGRLTLLASALSGRVVEVVAGEPGEPPWTDGRSVFVGAGIGSRKQIEAVAVQASLLAAGSLEPAIVRELKGRPVLARRYLAVEGHRALAAIEHVLPPGVRSLIDPEVAARADSPAASLAAALARKAVADPTESFGVIRPRELLASIHRADSSGTTPQDLAREEPRRVLAALPAGRDHEDRSTAADLFSVSAGRGVLGRLLRQVLQAARRAGAGGPPGAGEPTRRARSGKRSASHVLLSMQKAPARLEEALREGRGAKYPEWNVYRQRYRQDWCTVWEIEAPPTSSTPLTLADRYGLRWSLARLGLGLQRCRRRVQGDDVDIDAAVEARVQVIAGAPPDEAVYVESLRRRRDLAVLLLLDISGSAAEPGWAAQSVHEQQRAVAAALAVALHDLGDRVALYAYRSQGRKAVQLVPVKRFDDDLDAVVMRRLQGLAPGGYSRLGAAIRHGAAVLQDRGGTSRRLLVVLSDGLAYDHGYERVYGAADARRALAEARRRGIGCLCLAVGASTDAEGLRRVFGTATHATIPGPEHLRRVIGPLFRAALRSAEVRPKRH